QSTRTQGFPPTKVHPSHPQRLRTSASPPQHWRLCPLRSLILIPSSFLALATGAPVTTPNDRLVPVMGLEDLHAEAAAGLGRGATNIPGHKPAFRSGCLEPRPPSVIRRPRQRQADFFFVAQVRARGFRKTLAIKKRLHLASPTAKLSIHSSVIADHLYP